MNIGRLNKRITIQEQSSSYDAAGQPVESWSDFATVWADIKYNSGKETIKADAMASTAKASIRIRYKQGINAGMRVVYQTTTYEILAVLPHVAEKRYLDMAVRAVNEVSP